MGMAAWWVIGIQLSRPVWAFIQEPVQSPERVRTEIPYRNGKVTLISDFQERISKTQYRASGDVRITYQDIVITCDEAEYDEATGKGAAKGHLHFSQKRQWFACSRAVFSFGDQTGTFYDAEGFTDQEFLIRGRTIIKTGPDTYKVQEGFVTACQETNPKWSFSVSGATVHVDKTTRLHNTLFKVKRIPILYTPYLILPMETKKRSSGLIPPHTGNSSSKGRVFSLGYYQTLGRSADLTTYGDYFSLRGLAIGGIFRARPNPRTRLFLQGYGIDDRQGQGGANLIIDGESTLGHGFRAVAAANITTSFAFRQAFSDSFRLATVPEERSIFFLTQNEDSFSTNIAVLRDEVRFPARSLVIRQSPTIEFLSLGKTLGRTPLIFELRAAADGLSRVDSVLETPTLVQRLDFYPRITVRLPALAGFSLVPSAGIRETYYSAQVAENASLEIKPQSISRQYFDFDLNVRMPTIERSFDNSRLGGFKHVIEPFAIYRLIHGIDNMRAIIRFDEQDAIADTSEFEFGIVNRFFKKRGQAAQAQTYEVLSFALVQKYYFDPTFGGALQPGRSNQFYPLYTTTGFSLTGSERRFPPTNAIVRVTPRPSISFDVRADLDTAVHRLRDASLSANWQLAKLTAGGTYFKTNALEPGTFGSHHVQGQIGYGDPSRGFSAGGALSYDIRNSSFLNSNVRLNYAWDCCGIALQFQQFNLGLRTESRFTFSFSLKGIGNFGNIKRPESLF
jgi:LPS-assembly protein